MDRVAAGSASGIYYAIVDGAQVSFGIRWYNNPLVVEDGGAAAAHRATSATPGRTSTAPRCPTGRGCCARRCDRAAGTGVPKTFLERSLTLATYDGWQIDVIARNTTDEKQGDVVADEPVLTMAEMEALATSDAWYA